MVHFPAPRLCTALFAVAVTAGPALADPSDIVDVMARQAAGAWRFDVTLRHPDTGWNHYADGWEVRAPDGRVLGTRTLFHPHVEEQPFTRSLGGVKIPEGIDTVMVHARCNVDGWADPGVKVTLPRE